MTRTLPPGYTVRPRPSGKHDIISGNGQHAGHIQPDHAGRPLPHDHTGHPMQAFPRLETWDQAAARIARSHLAYNARLPHHHALALLPLHQIAARAWDRAHHIATTGTHLDRLDDRTWQLSDSSRADNAAFLDRNPNRESFIAAQASGRDTVLADTAGESIDLLTEHLRIGDHLWATAAPQIHPYGWREITDIQPFDHGNGARVTVRTAKGPDPHMDLHAERDHTILVRR